MHAGSDWAKRGRSRNKTGQRNMGDQNEQSARSSEATGPALQAAGGMADDMVLPFRAEASAINGRVVRLSGVIDTILTAHAYPEPIAILLGEALTAVAILGSTLKFGARLTLQTQTDGPAHFVVADYQSPGHLRGYIAYKAEALDAAPDAYLSEARRAALLGKGRLAMTIDPGPGLTQYQGLVEVNGDTMATAARKYFRQSEQLP
ncbi:MAG: Hsp33 family molecular chaperone HslO, partial [Pseudomonadota bacterium]